MNKEQLKYLTEAAKTAYDSIPEDTSYSTVFADDGIQITKIKEDSYMISRPIVLLDIDRVNIRAIVDSKEVIRAIERLLEVIKEKEGFRRDHLSSSDNPSPKYREKPIDARAIFEMEEYNGYPVTEYTCYTCGDVYICEYAFDMYNLNSDCLREK
jgi:hypothetical protein